MPHFNIEAYFQFQEKHICKAQQTFLFQTVALLSTPMCSPCLPHLSAAVPNHFWDTSEALTSLNRTLLYKTAC